VHADYRRNSADLYKSLTINILKHEGRLGILGVRRVKLDSKLGHLPSWVPDWTVGDLTWSSSKVEAIAHENAEFGGEPRQCFYKAAGNSPYALSLDHQGDLLGMTARSLTRSLR
jgi:hypothetical protein